MNDNAHDPVRRRLLAAALLPGLEQLLPSLRRKSDSYAEWFSAVQIDDANRCKQLLQRGFDPNTPEPERVDTALILAIRHKSWKVFDLLLASKATNLNARSRNGDTALMVAAFSSEVTAVRKLTDKGAEVNRPEWTALHYAAAVGSVQVIRILLEHSAYIDAESPNKTTPLMMAARGGHDKAVQLLLDEGADASLKNELGLDAIDFARAQKHEHIVRLLQERAGQAAAQATPNDKDSRPVSETTRENLTQEISAEDTGAESDAETPSGNSDSGNAE